MYSKIIFITLFFAVFETASASNNEVVPLNITDCEQTYEMGPGNYRLANDVVCNVGSWRANDSLIVLRPGAKLDLNGKKIVFQDSPQLNSAITLMGNGKLYSSVEGGTISGFYSAVVAKGHKNVIEHLQVQKNIRGILVEGDKNSVFKITAYKNGGITSQSADTMTAEAFGIVVQGNDNLIEKNKIFDNGYTVKIGAAVNSVFVQARGIHVVGHRNKILQNDIEQLGAQANANINGQAYVEGIYVDGKNNEVSHNKLSDLHAKGQRLEVAGLETGALLYGILATLPSGESAQNVISNNKIRGLESIGALRTSCSDCGTTDTDNVTAEAYGLAAYYNNQYVSKNDIQDVSAHAPSMVRLIGLHLVDYNHVVTDNSIMDVSLAEESGKPKSAPKVSKVTGISVDTQSSRVMHNTVRNTAGNGIKASFFSTSNTLSANSSRGNNQGFDFIEASNDVNQPNTPVCRNQWLGNEIATASYWPETCFESGVRNTTSVRSN